MPVWGRYFDGQTSRSYQVQFEVAEGTASLRGDIERDCPTTELRVSEKMRHVARRITYPDGAFLEIEDHAGVESMLRQNGHRDTLTARMQQSWRATLAALVATVAAVLAGYFYGIPAASSVMAKALPETVEQRLGQESLSLLDSRWFAPSELPENQRQKIIENFRRLHAHVKNAPDYEIIFRKSKIGPNAFALPAGKIVLTDELVTLLDDADAINAVLAHELGHLYERHITQRVIQGSLTGAASATLFGDVPASLAAVPTLLLDLRYSRDAEREADDFALSLLQQNNLSPSKLALVFQKLDSGSEQRFPYLSTHPSSAERIERLHRAK